MKDLLKAFARYEHLQSSCALALVILTHGGGNDILFGTDGEMCTENDISIPNNYISKLDIIENFKPESCPSMIHKPKLFILQACRGGLYLFLICTYFYIPEK